ncbi:MAG: choline kinase [Cocleimonas sp.]|jgi:choline kinase
MTKNKNIPTTAIILAAGVGSRIRPLTDNCPKCLLTIDGKTILERMITNIQECGIDDFVIVLGYLEEQIKDFVGVTFPDLKVTFIVNELYAETNTGYSLMLAADAVNGKGFVKFDADVVFDKMILNDLIDSDFASCLCIDTNIQLEAEEIKVAVHENNRITHASKILDPKDAIGESIGIEKISPETAATLFTELRLMMEDQTNHQEYYEAAYERLIEKDVAFFALNITGLKWVEIDTLEDFSEAAKLFQVAEVVPQINKFDNDPSPQSSSAIV